MLEVRPKRVKRISKETPPLIAAPLSAGRREEKQRPVRRAASAARVDKV
jgi:hypothetical protein